MQLPLNLLELLLFLLYVVAGDFWPLWYFVLPLAFAVEFNQLTSSGSVFICCCCFYSEFVVESVNPIFVVVVLLELMALICQGLPKDRSMALSNGS